MEVVTALHQVAENIDQLERGRSLPSSPNAAAYRALIGRGKCFVPYTAKDGLAFVPSRFAGYVKNDLATHQKNRDKIDGKETNPALSKIFRSQPRVDESLERHYLSFCAQIGAKPSLIARKYWVTPEALEILESDETRQIIRNPEITETEKQQLVKARIGQGQFRDQLLSYWLSCCLTGCELQGVLRASHIKPWRTSSNAERLDLYNGLLLSPNMDALFDKGLISFEDTGEIMISSQLSESALKSLGCSSEMKVALKPEHAKYLAYHRANQFLGAAG